VRICRGSGGRAAATGKQRIYCRVTARESAAARLIRRDTELIELLEKHAVYQRPLLIRAEGREFRIRLGYRQVGLAGDRFDIRYQLLLIASGRFNDLLQESRII